MKQLSFLFLNIFMTVVLFAAVHSEFPISYEIGGNVTYYLDSTTKPSFLDFSADLQVGIMLTIFGIGADIGISHMSDLTACIYPITLYCV